MTKRGVEAHAGLSSAEAARRLAKEGANEVREHRAPHWLRSSAGCWHPSVWLLAAAAVLFGARQRMNELGLALALLLVNVAIGSSFARRASRCAAALRTTAPLRTRVERSGVWSLVPAATLVRGDLLRLAAGDIVPADVRILTGLLVLDTNTSTSPPSSRPIERWANDVIHAGSLVRSGESTGIVVATGARTRHSRDVELVMPGLATSRVSQVASRASRQLLVAASIAVSFGVGLASVHGAAIADSCAIALLLLASTSSPMLVIAVSAMMSVAAVQLAERGVVVTRTNVLEDAARLDVLCTDATTAVDANEWARRLDEIGVSIKWLTAATLSAAESAAKALGTGPVVRAADFRRNQRLIHDHAGVAEVLPADALDCLRQLQEAEHVVGATGESVDDHAALRRADVGIAVHGAVDVARAGAGVLLMSEGFGAIVDLVLSSRAVHDRVMTWLVDGLSRCVLIGGFVGATLAFTDRLVMSATGLLLLLLLLDLVKPALTADRVSASLTPARHDDGAPLVVAVALGAAQVVEALGILAIGSTIFDLAERSDVLDTFSFELLLFFSIFSILSIRERRSFWRSAPSPSLTLGLASIAVVGLWLGTFGGLGVAPLGIARLLFTAGGALISCLGINDALKVSLFATAAPVRANGTQPGFG